MILFPSALNYWYHFSHFSKKISEENDSETIAGHFLHTLHGRKPTETEEKVMNISLILYAEHEFNASIANEASEQIPISVLKFLPITLWSTAI